MTHELSDEEMINFVLNIDEEVCDWDFTLDLLIAVAARIYNSKSEFMSLEESYHEKSREVIRMLKEITLAPKIDKTMAEERE